MRKIVAGVFVSLDGVMQAPGGPTEDPTGGFKFGGWTVRYFDDESGHQMGELFSSPFDLLLGRTTYDIFAAYWPYIETDPSKSTFDSLNAQVATTFNKATKYVATHSPDTLTWQNSKALGRDVIASVRELREQNGPLLLIQGSSTLIRQLLANGLIDQLRLITYPVVLGRGKRLFGEDAAPTSLTLAKSFVASSGVIFATYERAGEVKTGSFIDDKPSPAEVERRRKMVGR